MKKFYLAGLLCLFSVPATVFGCSCANHPPALAYNDARVVFIGRMLGGTEKLSFDHLEARGEKAGKKEGEVVPLHAAMRNFSFESDVKNVKLKLSESRPVSVGCSDKDQP